MRLDQGSERVPVPGARPPEQFRRHGATSVSIVPSLRYGHRQPAELVAAGPTSSAQAPVSARMSASTRRRVRQNGERNTMSLSSAAGSPGVAPATIANGTVLV